jgi:hypothetical protein
MLHLAIEFNVEFVHEGINDHTCILVHLLGELRIQRGSFRAGMAHFGLNSAQVKITLGEMGTIAMAQTVRGDMLGLIKSEGSRVTLKKDQIALPSLAKCRAG